MSSTTKTNLVYSTIIVLGLIAFSYLISFGKDFSGVAFLFVTLLGGTFAITTACVMFFLLYRSKKYFNSILFLTSALLNFTNSYVFLMWLTSGDNDLDILFVSITALPPLFFIIQTILFIKFNKLHIQA